jgi:hypothetical protein
MKKSAMQNHMGLADYKNLGFIPFGARRKQCFENGGICL